MTASELAARLEARPSGEGQWTARCPAHDDRQASLSIGEGRGGRVLVNCFAGCEFEAILAAMGLQAKDLRPDEDTPRQSPGNGINTATPPRRPRKHAGRSVARPRATPLQHPCNAPPNEQAPEAGLTLAELAAAKKLPEEFLRSLGLGNTRRNGQPQVRIPYYGADGEVRATRYRVSLRVKPRFLWQKGSKVMPYGLERLGQAREAGWVLLVEGESDCWTLWHAGLPALGIPGKATWQPIWEAYLHGIPEVFVWQEPDAQDFTWRLFRDIPHLRVIAAPADVKDPSEAHCAGQDVAAFIAALRAQAPPAADLVNERRQARLAELEATAAPALAETDPLVLVERAIREGGYAGDLRAALLVYLACTSRVLLVRPGSMLPHLLMLGSPSSGKSWTVHQALRLHPEEAVHKIDASSSRTLIYDDADLEHRVVVFGEADSLASSEDNPAASAIRNMLQDNELSYDVTVKDPRTGDHKVRRICKPGPTVLITTAVRPLGQQLMSRLFSVEMPDTPEHLRKALAAQAAREVATGGIPDAPPELLALQGYLQAKAPWTVVVSFAPALAEAAGRTNTAARATRDFEKLLSLVKAVCILRHRHRQCDAAGRWVASLEDYETVRVLAGHIYAAAAQGVTETMRQTVAAVVRLQQKGDARDARVSVTELAKALGISKSAASRRAGVAVRAGYLVNLNADRRGAPASLIPGEPLPDPDEGLPTLLWEPESAGGGSRKRGVL